MDTYGIAAMSMSLSQMKLAQSVDLAMMRKVMDLQQQSVEQMLNMADAVDTAAAVAPPSEHLLDVLV
ncbi:MAG: YjfB family protein [Clostridiales Family XIII bacterium]|nr:YjfB family protein [Clostridiales Family XIII bacterium]